MTSRNEGGAHAIGGFDIVEQAADHSGTSETAAAVTSVKESCAIRVTEGTTYSEHGVAPCRI